MMYWTFPCSDPPAPAPRTWNITVQGSPCPGLDPSSTPQNIGPYCTGTYSAPSLSFQIWACNVQVPLAVLPPPPNMLKLVHYETLLANGRSQSASVKNSKEKYMSHFAYACKMRYPLNLVLENSEYLWSY